MARQQTKDLHQKHQAILSKLLKDDDNKYCVDCDAKGEYTGLLLFSDHQTYIHRIDRYIHTLHYTDNYYDNNDT